MADTRSDDIRDEIRRQIISGRLPAGARLPTERRLAAHYDASLTTINKVMAGLELGGLLDRRRGTGTFVRPELAVRALGVVLGPPDAPPGPRFWATLAKAALESGTKGTGGVRAYLAAGTAPPGESALARDAAAGRLAGALLLGAGPGTAETLGPIGLPWVHVAGEGVGPAVGIAWREAVGEAAARLLGQGAWPLAIALAAGPWADEMAAGYADALAVRGRPVEESLIGRAGAADGPAGWAWASGALARGARGLLLLGFEPEGALAAVADAAVRVPEDVAVVVAALAGQAPAFRVPLARLELDPVALVQAGLDVLTESGRLAAAGTPENVAATVFPDGPDGAAPKRWLPPFPPLPPCAPRRRLQPRFIAGATLHA